ncbi:MraY family glycosyltransferase [Georgenia sp. Z1344]|uniref:MraY family glycosyltransferase n=1 Tax=Georgenia sp. Z1344 TaxID=3416706 RepID=UPI003CE764A0
MRTYLLVAALAAVVTYLLTPVLRRLAVRIGALTAVRDRDVHAVPTPRLGGLAMLLGFAAAMVLASRIPYLEAVFAQSSQAWGVLLGATVICLIGVADDVWDLDWLTKLAGQFLAAGLMAWQGVQLITFPIFGLTIGSSAFSLIATVLIVVVVVNAVNFVDGLDGLAAGMILIGASSFFLFTYLLARDASPGNYANVASAVLAALAGVCLGFLPHNLHPARIFMGDSGAMFLGLVLSGAAIIVTGQIDPAALSTSRALPAFVPILIPVAVLAVPLIEIVTSVVRRVGAGRSPFAADASHMHHRLLRLGHSHRAAVGILHLWTAVVSGTAVSLAFFQLEQVAIGAGAAVLVALVLTARLLPTYRKPTSRSSQ